MQDWRHGDEFHYLFNCSYHTYDRPLENYSFVVFEKKHVLKFHEFTNTEDVSLLT